MSALPVELELKLQREREGRCGNCGIDTHRKGSGITVVGEVHRGRCLFCYPFDDGIRSITASITTSRAQTSFDAASLSKSSVRRGRIGEHSREEEDYFDDALSYRSPPAGRAVLPTGSRRAEMLKEGGRFVAEESPPSSRSKGSATDEAKNAEEKPLKNQAVQNHKRSVRSFEPTVGRPKGLNKDGVELDSGGSADGCEGNISSDFSRRSNKRKGESTTSSASSKKPKEIKPGSHHSSLPDSPHDYVQSIISDAKAKPQNAALQDKSIEKLRLGMEDEGNNREWVDAIVTAGGIDMILEAMKNHKQKAAVQFEGCKMLAIVAWAGDDNKIASAGGIAAVLRSMKSTKTGKVAEAGMEALVNLSTKPDLRAKIIGEGGLEVVCATLAAKHRNAKLQSEGCNFFLNLASCGDVGNAIKISNVGAIPLIIAAVKNHTKYENVVQTACEALQNLAVCNEVRSIIAYSGGIDMIMELMDNEIERLQESILDVLKNLTTEHSAVQLEVALGGGIAKSINLMKEFPENEKLIEKLCVVLQNLSSQSESADLIVKQKGISEVIVAMKKHNQSGRVQEEACLLLWKLCSVKSAVQFLKLDEIQTLLVATAAKFPNECGATISKIKQRIGAAE